MGFSPRRKKKDNDDAESYQSGRSWRSGRSGASSSSSKKKGLKKLGSIFGKKRRLRGKDDGSSVGESSNYSHDDAEIDLRDNFDPYARPDGRIQGQHASASFDGTFICDRAPMVLFIVIVKY